MSIDYFYHTPQKKWQIVEAISFYDSRASYSSFIDLLQVVKGDLITVGETQTSLRKGCLAKLEEVQSLLDLAVHRNDTRPQNLSELNGNTPSNVNDSANTAPPNSALNDQSNIIAISDTFNNNGQVNISTSTISVTDNTMNGRKRNRENVNPRGSSNAEDSTDNHNAYALSLNEGKVRYSMSPPSAEAETPHRPKLRKIQLATLVKLFYFGTSFSANNPLTASDYQASKSQQKQNTSLKSLELFEPLATLLEDISFDAFLHTLWTFKFDESTHPDRLTQHSLQFFEIVQHSLCFFHLVCQTVPLFAQNHERTHFVENVIPSLLALAKITGFIEFKWCETPFLSSKCLNLQEYNYDNRSTPASKLIDALGILKTHNNMELVIVEASRHGSLKENTTHSIEDSLKILECGVSALRKELVQYPNASLATFQKLKVFSLQIIKTQVTLSEMSLHDKDHWKFIERRSATLPTNWDDRISYIQYLELLATLFDGISTTQQVQKQLVRENIGLCEYDGSSAESISHGMRSA